MMPKAAQGAPAQEQDDGAIPLALGQEIMIREMKANFSSNKGLLTCLTGAVKDHAVAIKSPASAAALK